MSSGKSSDGPVKCGTPEFHIDSWLEPPNGLEIVVHEFDIARLSILEIPERYNQVGLKMIRIFTFTLYIIVDSLCYFKTFTSRNC